MKLFVRILIALLFAAPSIQSKPQAPRTLKEPKALRSIRGKTLGTIVWTTSRHGKWDIYKMNSDGTGKVRLTNDQEKNDHPVWSKDGKWIYYQRNEDIYRMRSDGSNSHIVVRNGISPDISWDNTKLIYVVVEEVNGSDKTSIMLHDLEKGTTDEIIPARAPEFKDYILGYPTISPDGQRLAFASTYPEVWSIHIMGIDGSNRSVFARGCQPHYRPDGLMLVWITSGYHDVYIGTSDGNNQSPFEDSIPGRPHNYFSKWSNNGEYIVFAASPDFDHDTGDYEIYIKPFNGGEAERLTFHPGTDKWPDLFFPVHTLTLASDPGGTTEPSPGAHFYEVDAEARIKAVADKNYRFSNWSGDASGLTNPLTVTMDSDKSITANFLGIFPPMYFRGQKVLNRTLFRAEYINNLTWQANPDDQNIIKYRIYQIEGETQSLVAEVNASTFRYMHRNVDESKVYIYSIEAVNSDGGVSVPAYITVQ